MLVARRYGMRGFTTQGYVTGSADIPPGGTTVALPENSSLTMLHRQVASYSSVQMLSALQRYQTQLAQNEAPTSQMAADAAGQSNVPTFVPDTSQPPTAPMPLPPGDTTVGETVSDGSGDLVIPG